MIIDNLKNCEKYFSVHKNFEKAFDFLKKAVSENYTPGRYEIDGVDVSIEKPIKSNINAIFSYEFI